MSDRRVEWIRAQLDATEAALEEYRKHRQDGQHLNYAGQAPDAYDDYDSCYLCVETSRANQYSDQEFGRADVEAKRALLDEHPCAPAYDDSLHGHPAPRICLTCDHDEISGERTLWPCKTVRLLAEGFRGRPGYEEAMRNE